MLNESELIELQRIADKAAEKIRHPDDCDCMAQFNRKFKPATCAELVREVLRLRDLAEKFAFEESGGSEERVEMLRTFHGRSQYE